MLKVGRGAHAPAFLVMDTIAAANRRQAALPPGAPHVIRMEVGQPGTGAPAGAVQAAQAALRAADEVAQLQEENRAALQTVRHAAAKLDAMGEALRTAKARPDTLNSGAPGNTWWVGFLQMQIEFLRYLALLHMQ